MEPMTKCPIKSTPLSSLTYQSAVEKPADCDGGGEDPGHVADDDAAEDLKERGWERDMRMRKICDGTAD